MPHDVPLRRPGGYRRLTSGGSSRVTARARRAALAALLGFLAALLPGTASAGGPLAWTAHAVASDRGSWHYLAAEDGRVFRSRSHGRSWQGVGSVPGGPVRELAVHPRDEKELFAAAEQGLYRSRDGGRRWVPLGDFTYARSLVYDPADPDRLYAIVRSSRGLPAVAASEDGGDTWRSLTGPTPPWGGPSPLGSATHLAVVPGDPSTLLVAVAWAPFCCSYSFPLLASTDGGATWTQRDGGANWSALVASTLEPGLVYAGDGGYRGPPGGVERSTDSGVTWSPTMHLPELVFPAIGSITPDSVTPGRVYAVGSEWPAEPPALFASADRGQTWTEAPLPAPDPVSLVPHPDRAGQVFLLTRTGLFRTGDDGSTWRRLDRGLRRG